MTSTDPTIVRLSEAGPEEAPVMHQGRSLRVEAWGHLSDGTVVAVVRDGTKLVPADSVRARPA